LGAQLGGVNMSTEEVRKQNRQLTDPMPKSLEDIRCDLDYWEEHQNDGEPDSNWWKQVQSRIDGLRHRERRFLAIQPSVSVINNAVGPNARINQNSLDQSVNEVSAGIRSKDWEHLAEQFSMACRFLRADSQWTSETGQVTWRIAGGDGKLCEALLFKAGAMLLKSPQVSAKLPKDIISQTDNMDRWLLYLKYRGCHKVDLIGDEPVSTGSRIFHEFGCIRNLATDSARICIECSAFEI
jgi:hypothetical protein